MGGEDKVHLFVDGSSERMALAYQRMPPAIRNSTVWCRTAEEAIQVLKDYRARLDAVSLVHDLNEFIQGDTRREDSGMEIVRMLEKSNEDWTGCTFIVHGHGVGDSKMVNRLQNAGFTATHKRFGQ